MNPRLLVIISLILTLISQSFSQDSLREALSGGDVSQIGQEDKRTIVFASERDGNREIYLINLDGSGLKRLTNNSRWDGRPEWSFDGNQFLFCSVDDGGAEDLYIMNADGSNLKQITHSTYREYHPTWSHDGKKIAFDISGEGGQDIYTFNTDGTGLKRITTCGGMMPSWSPDDKYIAFTGKTSRYNTDIYIINTDGSNLRQLTRMENLDEFADWSPDGKMLLFWNGGSTYTFSPDGSNLTKVTSGTYAKWRPGKH